MTFELECRRQDGQSPFDGATLCCTENFTATTLVAALSCIAEVLQKDFGQSPLYFADCWLEHDGILSREELTSWEKLQQEVYSDSSLKQVFSYWDHEVRRTYISNNNEFLLRYYFKDNKNNKIHIHSRNGFDITSTPEIINKIEEKLIKINISKIKQENPTAYFLERGHPAWQTTFYQDSLLNYRKSPFYNQSLSFRDSLTKKEN